MIFDKIYTDKQTNWIEEEVGEMDFLEAAVILIPSLTGMAVTVYDGDRRVLEQFEEQFCFSGELQRLFRAEELQNFLEESPGEDIYEITDAIETHLLVFQIRKLWILLGPYMEEEWRESSVRCRLGKLGFSQAAILPYKTYRCKLPVSCWEQAVKAALLLLEHSGEKGTKRKVKLINTNRDDLDSSLTFSDQYETANIVNRRYYLEERFMEAVSLGETEKALGILSEIKAVCADLRFMSPDLRDQVAGAGIIRTLVRMAAKRGGLSPILIDSISQEYAQKMQHTDSQEKLDSLTLQLVERFCREVQKEKKNSYSIYVKKAIEYMDINLSRPITIAELSAAAGINQTRFVKIFSQETKMTMKQYLARKRCELAAELLLESRMSIQEISAYVGYPDNNYFSKVFKANKKISPLDYRKKHWSSGKRENQNQSSF